MAKKKSLGTSEKVEEARERKSSAKKSAAAAAEREKEDTYWSQYDNPKGKKDAKREEAERKREEAAAKKAEVRRLEMEEAAALQAGKSKAARPAVGKVTQHQVRRTKAAEATAAAESAEAAALAAKRAVGEEAYAASLDVENVNQLDTGVDASGLDSALQQLDVGVGAVDRHPER